MPTKATTQLAAKASKADTAESRFAAMVTLEAVEPKGNLADVEVVLLAADHLDGEKLAAELDKTEAQVRDLSHQR
jgi:N-acetyl-gamma-glutamylphosphate reductase